MYADMCSPASGLRTMNDFETRIDLALTSARLKALRDYWLELRRVPHVPKWSQFDWLHLPDLLPCYALVDVLRDPLRFRYEYIGSNIVTMAGRDATGAWLDEVLYPNTLETIVWPYRFVAENREPVATVGPVEFVDKGWNTLEHLFLPFTDESDVVSKVLCCWLVMKVPNVRNEHVTLDWQAD